MRPKDIVRQFVRFATRYGIQFFVSVVKLMPRRFVYGFAHGVACIGFSVAVRQRRIAFESLSIAFGNEKTLQEKKKIAFGCFEHMIKSALEFLMLTERPELINESVTIEGIEHLDRALAKGKGVVAVSAHLGNFPLMLSRIVRAGYKLDCVMRLMRDPWVNTYFERMRTAMGVGSVYTQPRKQCVVKSFETLRNNRILFIQLDQNFGTGGVFVDFFGKKAGTAKGPIVFALRTQAPIVPMFIYRENNNHHRIVIELEVPLLEGKDPDETIMLTAAYLTKIIERYIRQHPAEWGWIHRRWKARPQEEREALHRPATAHEHEEFV